ncbi:hypothetical protein L204_105052 [Cryptococcus depauperatus]
MSTEPPIDQIEAVVDSIVSYPEAQEYKDLELSVQDAHPVLQDLAGPSTTFIPRQPSPPLPDLKSRSFPTVDADSGEDDDDDEPIAELPIYLSCGLKGLDLYQYPLQHRDISVPTWARDRGKTISARVKERVCRIEVEIPVDAGATYWREDRASDLGFVVDVQNGDDGPVGGFGFGTQKDKKTKENVHKKKDKKWGDKMRLRSEVVPNATGYYSGVIRNGALHLHPVDHIYQFRTSLAYLDDVDSKSRRRPTANGNADSDYEDSAKKKTKPVTAPTRQVRKVLDEDENDGSGSIKDFRNKMWAVEQKENEDEWIGYGWRSGVEDNAVVEALDTLILSSDKRERLAYDILASLPTLSLSNMSLGFVRVAHPKAFSFRPFGRTYATEVLKPNLSYLSVTHPDSSAPPEAKSLIKDHSEYLLNTYVRPPFLFTHGKSCTLTDSSGRNYLDFTAGIAVTALGHSDEGINRVMADQAAKLSHTSNLYWTEHAGELAKSLVEKTRAHGGLGLGFYQGGEKGGKVFFANSGTEANEGALKFARAYGKTVSADKTEIVCFSNAFHGRSMGALSCTSNPKYQTPFLPLIPGINVGKYNDMNEKSLGELINEKTCGVIVEPIQGEGGVEEGKKEWFEMLGKRCKEVGAVLIYDEIQCGLFRSGTMWAHSAFPADAQPDIVTMAKPLANGFPIGAIMVRSSIASTISPGMHGTTFGGQPLACAIGIHVLDRLSETSFSQQRKETSAHLGERVQKLPSMFPELIKETRGRGLIRGIAFKDECQPGQLVKLARERGVLLLTAGKDAVRLVPALVVSKAECDRAIDVVESCLHILSGKT